MAVAQTDCPCSYSDSDDSACRHLPRCSYNMNKDDLCRAGGKTLPDGNENHDVNNCRGNFDVFRIETGKS